MKKYNVNHYVIMYLIGYSFYFHQIYTQILYSKLKLQFAIPFLLGYLLLPLFLVFICKKINHKFNYKLNFMYKMLTIIYLAISSLIVINYVSVMIHNYYYQATNSLVVCFFLLLPLLYVVIKGSNIYYSLIFFVFIIFIGFKLLYGLNPNTNDLYPFYNILNIDNYFIVILLSIPLLIEPIILLSNNLIDSKINLKVIIPFTIIISFISIYSLLREISEFGLLLEILSFPYYESCKLITFDSNFDNIDYYYIFSLATSIFSRIPIFFFTIKDTFLLKTKHIIIIFILFFICLYLLVRKLAFYTQTIIPILCVSSFILIIMFIMTFFLKENKNVKG